MIIKDFLAKKLQRNKSHKDISRNRNCFENKSVSVVIIFGKKNISVPRVDKLFYSNISIPGIYANS